MPHPLRLAVVGHLRQVLQQGLAPGGTGRADVQRAEVRLRAAGQRAGVERRRQCREPAGDQLPDPVLLRLPVVGEMRTAPGPPVPGGLPGPGEPARRVGRARMRGRVGERLDRRQPHPEHPHVVGREAAQHRAQRPRRRVRYPAGGRQHAQTLVAADPLQPLVPLHRVPADELIPGRDAPRRRPERAQHHRRPLVLGDVPQHPARRRHPQHVMLAHQLVVPARLRLAYQADLQLKVPGISHPSLIPQTAPEVQLGQ